MKNQYNIEEGMIGLTEQYIIWECGPVRGHWGVALVGSLDGAVYARISC